MLPSRFHIEIANDCINYKTNLITPSYVSNEMKALHDDAQKAGIVIMNEIGVDPGIDHMSACKILDEIRTKKGEIHSFKSFCGGLMAPENDTNPWNYKFTWNPRNVVIAGQGPAAAFIEEKEYKYIPYGKLFQRIESIEIEGYGTFEGYANRNSLSYRPIYKLDTIPTIYRGTLRRPGFAQAWNIFVELGMTEDSYVLENSETLTPRNFINAFLPFQTGESVESKFKRLFTKEDDVLFHKFEWLGLFEDNEPIGLKNATPAQLLEKILVGKWKLNENDKDMLVMHHEFEYSIDNIRKRIISSMVNIGENQVYTSMSNTVGLPVAICGKMVLNETLKAKGVLIPVEKEIYDPILRELENYGITFQEKEITI
jgi:saccharopine dehydrogenase-like NADP-dependent oxidoreductase